MNVMGNFLLLEISKEGFEFAFRIGLLHLLLKNPVLFLESGLIRNSSRTFDH